MNKINREVADKLKSLNLLDHEYIHVIKNGEVYNVKTVADYEEKDGFYTSKGFNYHTSRTPIFYNSDKLVRIISAFDCVDGYAFYQNPEEFIELLDSADKILFEDEIVIG